MYNNMTGKQSDTEFWNTCTGHSTHFQVGRYNSKVEGGILQNLYAKQSHILLSL